MFLEKLKQIIEKEGQDKPEYLRSVLKMTLIEYVLGFIYTSPSYRNLLFKGGTCLRICYDLPRLSEDIDLDYKESIDIEQLRNSIVNYFKNELAYEDLYASITNNNQTITLKFPVLRKLGISNLSESDILYVKLDIQPTSFSNIIPDFMPKQNYIIKAYSLPLLFTGKINAIFTRDRQIGKENKSIPKGRDYFDLLWFLERGIKPEITQLDKSLNIETDLEFKIALDMKIFNIFDKFQNDILSDLVPFVSDKIALASFIESFMPLYKKFSLSIFDYRIPNENSRQNSVLDNLKLLLAQSKLAINDKVSITQDINAYEKGSSSIEILKAYNLIIK